MTTDLDQFASPPIYARAKAPTAVTVTIVPGTSGVDLTTVTAVALAVRIGVSDYRWPATIVTARRDQLVVRHVFDRLGDETQQPGRYRVIPEMTVPDGVRRAAAFYLAVLP